MGMGETIPRSFHQHLTGMEATNRGRICSARTQSLIKITDMIVVSTTLKYHLYNLEFILVLGARLDLATAYINQEALIFPFHRFNF